MNWKPVVVGVDATAQSAVAVATGWAIAQRAGVKCRLVHATHDVRSSLLMGMSPMTGDEIQRKVEDAAATQIANALRGHVPTDALRLIEFRAARIPDALAQAVHDHDADLVVLGGKHHNVLGRWFGGSSALNAARRLDVPILVTTDTVPAFKQVLVAVDLSYAARATIAAAARYAAVFGAKMRVIHAIEPVPVLPEVPPLVDTGEFQALTEARLLQEVWPLVPAGAERAMVHGVAAQAIERDAKELGADLVVVGSHGKGWWDRLLLGSVTERLLNHLPAALLVVPVPAPVETVPAARPEWAARAGSVPA